MEEKDNKYLIMEQYKIYSEAKDKFIDRQFSTNKFYLVINISILLVSYILSTFTPQYHATLVLSIIGLAVSIMWLMSVDTYQTLIKVKYAKVLEYIESKLPEQPYHKEFEEYTQLKKNKNIIVFGDLQKLLAEVVLLIYVASLATTLFNAITQFKDTIG